jgi:SAM-dependent methyltransferase
VRSYKASATLYDRTFFQSHLRGSSTSASVIVPLLLRNVSVKSVVDIGCGIGTWTAQFAANGVEDVTGVDGPHVDQSGLLIPHDRFIAHDLRMPIRLGRKYDLAVCLEVAEHLPPERAPGLVAELVSLAPCIMFSAAVRGQGGRDHQNEQYMSYWTHLFAEHNYEGLDLIRSTVWADDRVDWWYQQNLTVFAGPNHPLRSRGIAPSRDLIHPVLYDRYLRRFTRPTIGYLLSSFPGALGRSLKFHLRQLFARPGKPTAVRTTIPPYRPS